MKSKRMKMEEDLFALNKPEEENEERRPPKRRTPHPTSDKFINKNKKSNYRIVIYKHIHQYPKVPKWWYPLVFAVGFTISFALVMIFLI